MKTSFSETAYAKINLALHVRAREPDGYHRIETLFAFARDGDILSVEPSDELTLEISGPFASVLQGEQDNLVLRAARALRERFGIADGAVVRLEKMLPVASGIGGGSADAAAALRLLSRLWGITDKVVLEQIARGLGADVPACLYSLPMRGEGRGDLLEQLPSSGLEGMALLLVNPRVPVSTGAVFSAWDGCDRGGLNSGDPLAAALAGRNDLEAPARMLAPAIEDVLEFLRACEDVRLARMSGSGATCFALFETTEACADADRQLAEARSGWWRLKTELRRQVAVP